MSTWQELKNNPRLKKISDERIVVLKSVREYFWSKGFDETETPIAVRYASQEPYLNPFGVKIEHPNGGAHEFYLHTSPEYSMKKLLAAGYKNIFQIVKCFRNNEDFGGSHNPEFTMIEWYRSPGVLKNIMNDTEELFRSALKKLKRKHLEYKGQKITVAGKWDRLSMKQVFKKFLNVNLDEYLETENIKKLAESKGYKIGADESYEDIFFRIFLNEIEGKLGWEKPIFIYDYPARMCSLSKLSKDKRYAERFELYIGGLEVANAFGELTDAKLQKENLEKDKNLRNEFGKKTWPVDPEFIAALESGIGKEVAGVALGLDRMVVLCTGAKDINEVIFNNIKDQLN